MLLCLGMCSPTPRSPSSIFRCQRPVSTTALMCIFCTLGILNYSVHVLCARATKERSRVASTGDKKCEDGMLPRPSPPVSCIGWSQVVCQPPLEFGSNPGAACCAGHDECFGSDGYGTPLTCIEGRCERCGLRGMVLCSGAPRKSPIARPSVGSTCAAPTTVVR